MIPKNHLIAINVAVWLSMSMLPNAALAQAIPSLKDTFRKDFGIGTALNNAQIEERDPETTAFIDGD